MLLLLLLQVKILKGSRAQNDSVIQLRGGEAKFEMPEWKNLRWRFHC